ncbi:PLP-dependent aminotransferase family protein [Enterococcus sp.]|uniref:aminotransferase-like domain-containing protein n=1 Tax=Enterococcus sp. TaxID=35783 RepID=UPI0028998064|nr:PLP-dependent aminotransferase family protein [Enterococcus sp.]
MVHKIDKKSKQPLYQQIVAYFIDQIQSGLYGPGDRLPPERDLAADFSVNRSTVVKALDELKSLGWISRKQGSGSKVLEGRWGSRQAPLSYLRASLDSPYLQQDPFVTEIQQLRQDTEALDLYTGDLPPDLMPNFTFPAFTWEEIRQESQHLSASGYRPLEETLLRHLVDSFALPTSGQKLVITAGSTQGITLLMQVLLRSGDCIAAEDPSFLFALPLFSTMDVQLVGIKQDDEGILPLALERTLKEKKIKFLYLNPSFQNPTGHTMGLNRRKAIIALCQRYQVPIIEDDVFGELSLSETPPKLKTLAPETVIYLGSLSKLLGATIKIGWLLAPEALAEQFAQAKRRMSIDTTIFPQVLANSALQSPEFFSQKHLLLQEMAHRKTALEQILLPFKDDWQWQSIKGGLYFWLQWRHPSLHRNDWQVLLRNSLLGAPAFLFSNETNAVRLNYTRLSEKDLSLFTERFQKVTSQLKELSYERNH